MKSGSTRLCFVFRLKGFPVGCRSNFPGCYNREYKPLTEVWSIKSMKSSCLCECRTRSFSIVCAMIKVHELTKRSCSAIPRRIIHFNHTKKILNSSSQWICNISIIYHTQLPFSRAFDGSCINALKRLHTITGRKNSL